MMKNSIQAVNRLIKLELQLLWECVVINQPIILFKNFFIFIFGFLVWIGNVYKFKYMRFAMDERRTRGIVGVWVGLEVRIQLI